MNEFVAWVVFPLLALIACTGIGLLAERVARAQLEPAVLPPLGFATAIVLLGPLFATGAGEVPGLALLIAAALAGFALARRELASRLRPRLGAFAGLAAYALHIAPVVLGGTATFLGYNLLNDTAVHLAMVDWIGDHGARYLSGPASSYQSAILEYLGGEYPLGSHELLAALRPLSGLDPALVYQPFLALSAALAASALYAFIRALGTSARAAALGAVAALSSQLVFSFALQGGIKEITFITCLATAAALGRDVRLMALPAAALYAIYGFYALPWIFPLALFALVVARPGVREFTLGAGIFLLSIAVDLPSSIRYYRHGHDVLMKASELGPLAGPLKPIQAAGVWLNGDYRFAPAHSWITYGLAAIVLAFAVTGAWRRRPVLFLGPALFAWLISARASSPYIDAKLLVILSTAVVVTAALGVASMRGRRRALVAAIVLGGALLVSDALAYRMALLAPIDRLDELAAIDKRFAGRGPVLVNEFEEYTKHFMRRSRGSDPYEHWNAGRAELRNPRLMVGGHAYDLDRLTTSFIERWPLIALRRSPAESHPPSNYSLAWRGRFYEVWRHAGPAPLGHAALGRPPLSASSPLSCSEVRLLARRGTVVAALRPVPIVIDIRKTQPLPPGFYLDAQDAHAIDARKGGSLHGTFSGGGALRIWLRGRAFRRDRVLIDGRLVGIAKHLNGPNQWIDVGRVVLGEGEHTLELARPKRSLRPGDARADVIGPAVAVPEAPVRVVRGTAAVKQRCNQPADWIDVVAG